MSDIHFIKDNRESQVTLHMILMKAAEPSIQSEYLIINKHTRAQICKYRIQTLDLS